MLERVLGSATIRLPNRKFAATRRVYELTGLAQSPNTLDELVRRNTEFTYAYYMRLARLRESRYRRRLFDTMQFTGTSALHDAAEQGRGIVLLSAHIGDFDAAGAWLASELDITPVITVGSVAEAARQRFFDDARRSCGVVIRRLGATRRDDLLHDLQQGRMVLMMVDRRPIGRTVPMAFLGQTIHAPHAVWELARSADAVVVAGAAWRTDDGGSTLWCGVAQTGAEVAADDGLGAQRTIDELSDVVRSVPHQFHVPADLAQMSWRAAAAADRSVGNAR
jgi:lauroyl/myristoyl acyltransferase